LRPLRVPFVTIAIRRKKIIMKKLDSLFLGMFYRISNATYRAFSIDNYTLGTLSFVLALLASIGIGFAVYQTDFHDLDPRMDMFRKQSSIFGPVFFGALSIAALIYRKNLRNFLSLQHDLEKSLDIQRIFGTMLRWVPLCYFLLTLILAAFGGTKWWTMGDVFLAGIAIWFYSSKPPDMNLRMKKWADGERDRLHSGLEE
jgi:hypothetical protein